MACENGEIECAECDGHGYNNIIRCCGNALASGACCGNGIDDTEECDFCRGQGWRAATDDELANMAEAQAEDAASGEVDLRRIVKGWLDWYRFATRDDDNEYLNGKGWDDAEALAEMTDSAIGRPS